MASIYLCCLLWNACTSALLLSYFNVQSLISPRLSSTSWNPNCLTFIIKFSTFVNPQFLWLSFRFFDNLFQRICNRFSCYLSTEASGHISKIHLLQLEGTWCNGAQRPNVLTFLQPLQAAHAMINILIRGTLHLQRVLSYSLNAALKSNINGLPWWIAPTLLQ